jgi:hypothetical protein
MTSEKIYIVVAIIAAIICGGLLIYYFGQSGIKLGSYVFFGLFILSAITLFIIYYFAPKIMTVHEITELYVSSVLFIVVMGFARIKLLNSGDIDDLTFIPLFFYFIWSASAKIMNNWLNTGHGGVIYSDI